MLNWKDALKKRNKKMADENTAEQQLSQEYAQACAKLGNVEYQLQMLPAEKDALIAQMKDLSQKVFELRKAEAQKQATPQAPAQEVLPEAHHA
jgi:hypothetical protein